MDDLGKTIINLGLMGGGEGEGVFRQPVHVRLPVIFYGSIFSTKFGAKIIWGIKALPN